MQLRLSSPIFFFKVERILGKTTSWVCLHQFYKTSVDHPELLCFSCWLKCERHLEASGVNAVRAEWVTHTSEFTLNNGNTLSLNQTTSVVLNTLLLNDSSEASDLSVLLLSTGFCCPLKQSNIKKNDFNSLLLEVGNALINATAHHSDGSVQVLCRQVLCRLTATR